MDKTDPPSKFSSHDGIKHHATNIFNSPGSTLVHNCFVSPDGAESTAQLAAAQPLVTVHHAVSDQSCNFLFDTGATRSVISREVADRLGIRYAPSPTPLCLGNGEQVSVFESDPVIFTLQGPDGGIRLDPQPYLVLEGCPVQGLLGRTDVIQKYQAQFLNDCSILTDPVTGASFPFPKVTSSTHHISEVLMVNHPDHGESIDYIDQAVPGQVHLAPADIMDILNTSDEDFYQMQNNPEQYLLSLTSDDPASSRKTEDNHTFTRFATMISDLRTQIETDRLSNADEAHAQRLVSKLLECQEIFPDKCFVTSHPRDSKDEVRIQLKENHSLKYMLARKMNPTHLSEFRIQLADLVASGVVSMQRSQFGSPVMMVPKPGTSNELRMVVDFKRVNAELLPSMFQVPTLQTILENSAGYKYYSSLDLTAAYWQIRVHPNDRHLLATSSPLGSFVWHRLPMGLSIAGAAQQRRMIRIMGDFIGASQMRAIWAYVDDVLIASRATAFRTAMAQHVNDICVVLERFRTERVYLNASKCEFLRSNIKFVGHILSETGVAMCPTKRDAFRKLAPPTTPKELRHYIGVLVWLSPYISNFSARISPLSKLVNIKPREWFQHWGPAQRAAFADLSNAVSSSEILAPWDSSLKTTLSTDASTSTGFGATLWQGPVYGTSCHDGCRPVAYFSASMLPAQRQWTPFDMELKGVELALRHFSHLLKGIFFELHTDHMNLLRLPSLAPTVLGKKHERWIDTIALFQCKMVHVPGVDNVLADYLSRARARPVDPPMPGIAELFLVGPVSPTEPGTTLQVSGTPIQRPTAAHRGIPQGISPSACTFENFPNFHSRLLPIWYQEPGDAPLSNLATMLAAGTQVDTSRYGYQMDSGFITRVSQSRVKQIIPPPRVRGHLIRSIHENTVFHFGIKRTLAFIRRSYWWRTMEQDVRTTLKHCHTCNAWKPQLHPEHVRTPHAPAEFPMQRLLMDYATGLPPVTYRGVKYDGVCVFVDAFTKYVWAFPVSGAQVSEDLAQSFIHEIYKIDGLPDEFVSDRGSQLISGYFQAITARLGITQRFSLAAQARSHGQVERAVSLVQHCILSFDRNRSWLKDLDLMTTAINLGTHIVTGFTPHYALRGRPFRAAADVKRLSDGPAHAQVFLEAWFADHVIMFNALQRAQHAMGNRTFLSVSRDIPENTQVYIKRDAFPHLTKTKTQQRFYGPYTVSHATETTVVCKQVRQRNGTPIAVNREWVKILSPPPRDSTEVTLRDFSPRAAFEAEAQGEHTHVAESAALAEQPTPAGVSPLVQGKDNTWFFPEPIIDPFPGSQLSISVAYGFTFRHPNGQSMRVATTPAGPHCEAQWVSRHLMKKHGSLAMQERYASWKYNVSGKRFTHPEPVTPVLAQPGKRQCVRSGIVDTHRQG